MCNEDGGYTVAGRGSGLSVQGESSDFFDPSRRRSLGWRPLHSPWMRAMRSLVWRRLPRRLRQSVMRIGLARRRTPVALDAPAAAPIAIVGPLSTPTGIGEGGRLAGSALVALGHDVRCVDVSDVFRGTAPAGMPPPPLERGPGTVVLHFNPDNLTAMLTLLGRKRLRGKRIIGYWAWELMRIPDEWIAALAEVDEVWTPSRFVADAVRPFTDKPVRVVPHPVANGRTGTPRRADFGIGDEFLALAMFSFASSFPRKNPVAAVRAFRRAFGDSADRLLILKASDARESPEEMAELLEEIGEAPNVRIEERSLGGDERLDLIAGADVLISLHRSEGFGLAIAEAMLAGVPVIATGWSGNLEFMDERTALLVPYRMVEATDRRGVYAGGHYWADPDVDAAALHLAALAADPALARRIGEAGRAGAQRRLGLDGFAAAVAPLFRNAAVPRPGSVRGIAAQRLIEA
jgi:glycosyltransferase involved in cell wall biosynthesis